jgi:hypothetical protein
VQVDFPLGGSQSDEIAAIKLAVDTVHSQGVCMIPNVLPLELAAQCLEAAMGNFQALVQCACSPAAACVTDSSVLF